MDYGLYGILLKNILMLDLFQLLSSPDVKGVIGYKIHFSSCLNINVCWKCVYTSIL